MLSPKVQCIKRKLRTLWLVRYIVSTISPPYPYTTYTDLAPAQAPNQPNIMAAIENLGNQMEANHNAVQQQIAALEPQIAGINENVGQLTADVQLLHRLVLQTSNRMSKASILCVCIYVISILLHRPWLTYVVGSFKLHNLSVGNGRSSDYDVILFLSEDGTLQNPTHPPVGVHLIFNICREKLTFCPA